MKIHYPKHLRLVKSVFLLWLFLVIAKIFGFDFRLDSSLIFWSFLLLLSIFLIFEAIKNRKEIFILIKLFLTKIEKYFFLRTKKVKLLVFLSFKRIFPERLARKISPLSAYLLAPFFILILFLKRFLLKRINLLLFFLGSLWYHIFFQSLPLTSEILLFFIIVLWIFLISLYKIESKISIAIAVILLTVCPILLVGYNNEEIVERITTWVFIFFSIGIFQTFFDYLRGT